MSKRKRSSMSKLSGKTKNKVDQELKEEELTILMRSSIDWNALKLKVTDKETYEKLIATVKESTERNESVLSSRQGL